MGCREVANVPVYVSVPNMSLPHALQHVSLTTFIYLFTTYITLSINGTQVCSVLQHVSRKEQVTLPDELCVNIARDSSRNLRRAVLMFESCYVQNRDPNGGGLKPDTPVMQTDWEVYIKQLAADVTRNQSPQHLLSAREKLYELLINCIPADVIIKTLALELIKNLDDSLKHEVIESAAFYEHRIAMGSKDIFHLEAFLAQYMAIYKRYLNELFA